MWHPSAKFLLSLGRLQFSLRQMPLHSAYVRGHKSRLPTSCVTSPAIWCDLSSGRHFFFSPSSLTFGCNFGHLKMQQNMNEWLFFFPIDCCVCYLGTFTYGHCAHLLYTVTGVPVFRCTSWVHSVCIWQWASENQKQWLHIKWPVSCIIFSELEVVMLACRCWFRLGVFKIAGAAALWGLVSGASHHDILWPYYTTFLLSAALNLGAKFGRKSAREQHLVSEVFCICQGPLRIWHVFNAAAGERVTPE